MEMPGDLTPPPIQNRNIPKSLGCFPSSSQGVEEEAYQGSRPTHLQQTQGMHGAGCNRCDISSNRVQMDKRVSSGDGKLESKASNSRSTTSTHSVSRGGLPLKLSPELSRLIEDTAEARIALKMIGRLYSETVPGRSRQSEKVKSDAQQQVSIMLKKLSDRLKLEHLESISVDVLMLIEDALKIDLALELLSEVPAYSLTPGSKTGITAIETARHGLMVMRDMITRNIQQHLY